MVFRTYVNTRRGDPSERVRQPGCGPPDTHQPPGGGNQAAGPRPPRLRGHKGAGGYFPFYVLDYEYFKAVNGFKVT